jgi:hypothetical protein
MAIIRDKLFNPVGIGTTVAPIFTCPSGTKIFYSGFTLHNTNTSIETVRLFDVAASGGAVGVASTVPHRFLSISLASEETFIYEAPSDGIVHNSLNDTIQASSTTSNVVSITPHGTKDV